MARPGYTLLPASGRVEMDPTRQPGIQIHQIYLESAQFEHRSDFLSLPPSPPAEPLDVLMEAQYKFSDDQRAGVIRLVVRTNPDSDGFYRFSVIVGALIGILESDKNFTLAEYVDTAGIAVLVPFAREAVANITGRGRFGPIWLHPFNFRAVSSPTGSTDAPAPAATPAKERTAARKRG